MMHKEPLATTGGDGRARQETAVSADFLVSLLEKNQFTLPESEIQALMEAPPNTLEAQTVWQLQNLREAVAECMEHLNEKDLIILNGIFSESITYEELAKRLGLKTKSHIKEHIDNALKNLKELLLVHPTIQEYLGNTEYEDWE